MQTRSRDEGPAFSLRPFFTPFFTVSPRPLAERVVSVMWVSFSPDVHTVSE